jgi:ubiquinone/menaquinone biosynthesis C-methylase UbiE
MSQPPDPRKAASQARFGQYAAHYVTSSRHAKGGERAHLAALAALEPGMRALDVATGGGHMALALAQAQPAAHIVATDLTPAMLAGAQRFIAPQAPGVTYATADAEHLPFADGVFHAVTCRIAPHHFPEPWRFVQECARVLVSGGALIVQDNTVPDDPAAARYLDAFERLRDPSHGRMYAPYEWRGMCADADLTVDHEEILRAPAGLLEWAAVQENPPDVVKRLHVLLYQAPAAAAAWIAPRAVGTPDAAFDHVYVLFRARKK